MKNKIMCNKEMSQVIGMQNDLIESLNEKNRNIRKSSKNIVRVNNAVKTLSECGVCDESLAPIREYVTILAMDQVQIANAALCDTKGDEA